VAPEADAESMASKSGPVHRVGFIGIGAMGEPMARRLLEAGHEVAVWNRTKAKADPLASIGAIVCGEASAAADSADLVVTVLATEAAVESVLFDEGVADALAPGTTVIDMSSITPMGAQDHADRLRHKGIGHLDAPVSGGTKGAAEGTLAIMVGGEPTEFYRRRGILRVFGTPTLVGPSGSGQITKLANQVIVGVTIGAVSEALILVQQAGVDPGTVLQAIKGGFADSRVLREHGLRMIGSDFEPGAASRLQLKDLVNALAVAEGIGLSLPVTSAVSELYESLCANGGAELDHSALFSEIGRNSHG